jgi:hypothetical protein
VSNLIATPPIYSPDSHEAEGKQATLKINFDLNKDSNIEMELYDAQRGVMVASRQYNGLSAGANIVKYDGYDFTYLDSKGQTLFMTAFMLGHNELCQTYLKSGININEKDKDGLTLFYKYNLGVFETGKYFDEYRSQLIYLILHKADVTVKNKDGQTIYTKIATIEDCNKQLFAKLREVSRYDFKTTDNLGRTIMHACIWGKNLELLKVIHNIDDTLMNTPDKLNILPITYAALFGNKEIVIELIKKESFISSKKEIPDSVKKKFRPLLKNLKNL